MATSLGNQYTRIKSLVIPLSEQITKIQSLLSQYKQNQFAGAMLFGSCSRREATYRSDIDVMLIFDQDELNFSFVQKTRDSVESFFAVNQMSAVLIEPLRVEFQVVRINIFNSKEQATIKNLRQGQLLFDSKGELKKMMEKLSE